MGHQDDSFCYYLIFWRFSLKAILFPFILNQPDTVFHSMKEKEHVKYKEGEDERRRGRRECTKGKGGGARMGG